MPAVAEILSGKRSQIHCIEANSTVLEATMKMNRYQIGALVVTESGEIAGIFTERDVLRRVVAEQRSPGETAVGEVMTRDVLCVTPETDIDEAAAIFKTRRIRHLPICDEAKGLVGMLSIGDLNAHHASTQEQAIHFLSEYIYGRV